MFIESLIDIKHYGKNGGKEILSLKFGKYSSTICMKTVNAERLMLCLIVD